MLPFIKGCCVRNFSQSLIYCQVVYLPAKISKVQQLNLKSSKMFSNLSAHKNTETSQWKLRWVYLFMLNLLIINFTCLDVTDARYLPTRSQDDRLDKLRELLRDLLESEIQKTRAVNCNLETAVDIPPSVPDGRMPANNQVFRELGFMDRKRYFKREIAAALKRNVNQQNKN